MGQLLNLFITFSRIGAVTFGGGYAILPILRRELVEKKGWLTDDEMTDYYAVSQCVPGIISVNTSILAGYKVRGRGGGIAAALGVIFPSVVIIMVIAAFISSLSDNEIVARAFAGIRVCVCALIANVIIKLWKSAVVDRYALVVFALVLVLSIFAAAPAAVLIVVSGALGVGFSALRERLK